MGSSDADGVLAGCRVVAGVEDLLNEDRDRKWPNARFGWALACWVQPATLMKLSDVMCQRQPAKARAMHLTRVGGSGARTYESIMHEAEEAETKAWLL